MQLDRIEETTDAQGRPECFVSGYITDEDTGDVIPFAKWLSISEYSDYLAGTKLSEVLTTFSKFRVAQNKEEKESVVKVPKELFEQLKTSLDVVATADAKTTENALKDRVSVDFSNSIKQILAVESKKMVDEKVTAEDQPLGNVKG